jgi:DNA-binding transcriptional ArsR family regulator
VVVHAAYARPRDVRKPAQLSHDLEPIFVALADPARLAAVRLLRKKPLRSSEIATALSLSRPLASRHLRVLRRAGVVEERSEHDDARVRIYCLRAGAFTELRSWLDEVDASWRDQLQAFKAHAERKHGKVAARTSKLRI